MQYAPFLLLTGSLHPSAQLKATLPPCPHIDFINRTASVPCAVQHSVEALDSLTLAPKPSSWVKKG